MIKKLPLTVVSKLFDLIGLVITPFVASISAVQAKGGPIRFPLSYRVWDFFGLQPTNYHYYQPIYNVNSLPEDTWTTADPLYGINLNIDYQLNLLSSLSHYSDELKSFPIDKPAGYSLDYYYNNPNYSSGDGEILYSMVRQLKPKRVIEIGSGFSTRLTKQALAKNRENGVLADHTCIEPYEMEWLEALGTIKVIRAKVENVDLEIFRTLEKGDILFIDSSHVIRTGGDVFVEYLRILPILNPGVVIHIHDIFIPYEYPKNWIQEMRRFWDEQYILQAFLAFNSEFNIVLASHYLSREFPDEFADSCPMYARKLKPLPVSSFWIQRSH